MAITLDGTAGTTTPALTNSALTSGRVTYAGTSGVLQDSANLTFNGTGLVAATTIGVGGATPSTSGAGITFPATQSASTDVNTLDDYEEGTWTPTFGNCGTVGSVVAVYTKVGRVVTVNMAFTSTNMVANSSYWTLPFTATYNSAGEFSSNASITGIVEVAGSSNICYVATSVTTGFRIQVCAVYFTAT